MKTNFRKTESNQESESQSNQESESQSNQESESQSNQIKKDLTPKEFEEFIIKSGAKGSFMVYRSDKKDEELGIDEL